MKLSENFKTNLFAFLGAFVCLAIFISLKECSQDDSSNDTNSYYKSYSDDTTEQSITDNISAVKKSVTACLRNRTDYQNVHILNVEKVNEEDDEVTYRWEAEFKFQGVRCRQSGFVYYYKDGDVKDFKMLNNLKVAE